RCLYAPEVGGVGVAAEGGARVTAQQREVELLAEVIPERLQAERCLASALLPEQRDHLAVDAHLSAGLGAKPPDRLADHRFDPPGAGLPAREQGRERRRRVEREIAPAGCDLGEIEPALREPLLDCAAVYGRPDQERGIA